MSRINQDNNFSRFCSSFTLSDNNLASELVENRRFFKPITIEEIVIFMINHVTDMLDAICSDDFFTRTSWCFNLNILGHIQIVMLLILVSLADDLSQNLSPSSLSIFVHHIDTLRLKHFPLTNMPELKAAKYEKQKPSTCCASAQHCFVASFRRCFPFFTLRDQLVAQQKHLLRVEESCCEK